MRMVGDPEVPVRPERQRDRIERVAREVVMVERLAGGIERPDLVRSGRGEPDGAVVRIDGDREGIGGGAWELRAGEAHLVDVIGTLDRRRIEPADLAGLHLGEVDVPVLWIRDEGRGARAAGRRGEIPEVGAPAAARLDLADRIGAGLREPDLVGGGNDPVGVRPDPDRSPHVPGEGVEHADLVGRRLGEPDLAIRSGRDPCGERIRREQEIALINDGGEQLARFQRLQRRPTSHRFPHLAGTPRKPGRRNFPPMMK